MDSLFFIQRYMGSDDDDDSYHRASTSQLDEHINNFSDCDSGLATKKQKIMLDNSNCSDSVECINNRSSGGRDFVDSKRKSQKKGRRKKSELDVSDSLNSSVQIDNLVEILNDFDCSSAISGYNEEIISGVKSLKKKTKKNVKDIQILQSHEENGLQKLNMSNLQGSEIIDENSCGSMEATTEKNWAEVTNLKTMSNKKQKIKPAEQTQSSKECKSDVFNSENTEVLDLEIMKDKSQETESAEYSHKKDKPDLSNSGNTEAFFTIGQIQHKQDIKCRQTLPDWLSNPTYINFQEEKGAVSELNYLDSGTKENLSEEGIKYLFPVQLTVIPFLVKSAHFRRLTYHPSDICVSAPTGSGKTLAFVLPIVQALKIRIVTAIRALVVLPVSELAIQVYEVFKTFTRDTNLQVVLLIGQKSFLKEQNALVRFTSAKKALSLVDIIIATPGRIRDHIHRTDGFCLKTLRYLVIDEADRMMEEIQVGCLKPIEDAVFQGCHSSNCVCSGVYNDRKKSSERTCALDYQKFCEPLQKMLFSATLTRDPEQLHTLSLYKPKLFTASISNLNQKFIRRCIIPDKLTMLQVICDEGLKPMIICHLIKQHQFKRVLCFTESVKRAHKLHLVLEAMEIEVREISSSNHAVQRKIALKQFATGRVNVLVCSDLISRGIDIKNVDCVISYDVPQSDKIYVHRIGRTARAQKSGTAITLLSKGEIPHFKKILQFSGIEIPDTINIPSEDLKPLLGSYQAALSIAGAKLKKEKAGHRSKFSQKRKRKKNIK